MGRGGAFSEIGSVTPGMSGIRGGSEIALAVVASSALKSVLESIINKGIGSKEIGERKTVELVSCFEQVCELIIFTPTHARYLYFISSS